MPSVPEQPLPGKQVELPKVPTHEPTAEEAPKGKPNQNEQQYHYLTCYFNTSKRKEDGGGSNACKLDVV